MLLRFHLGSIGIIADVRQAILQISVDPSHQVSALVLRFVRNMKCILTGKERVGGEVMLLEVKNSELEWLKFEQHFIIQDSKFQKQKHLLNLYFDGNDILRSQTRTNQIKGKKVNQYYLYRTVTLRNLLY